MLCTQCYLRRGTCLNAMKRFYFIFLPVVLVFLYKQHFGEIKNKVFFKERGLLSLKGSVR